MHPDFPSRLKALIAEKMAGSWKDGWVYGRLKQEFELQPDELDVMASALGFKQSWNPGLHNLLETQWQAEADRWREREQGRVRARLEIEKRQIQDRIFQQQEQRTIDKLRKHLQEVNAAKRSPKELTDIERVLVTLVLNMRLEDQAWVLDKVLNRYRI